MEKDNNKDRKSNGSVLGIIVGSLVLFGVATVIISKAMPKLSGKLNKEFARISNAKNDNDEWGPVIEKKN